MSAEDRKRNYWKGSCACIHAGRTGLVISTLSLNEISAAISGTVLAQATPPLQSTPGAETNRLRRPSQSRQAPGPPTFRRSLRGPMPTHRNPAPAGISPPAAGEDRAVDPGAVNPDPGSMNPTDIFLLLIVQLRNPWAQARRGAWPRRRPLRASVPTGLSI